jgi:hypothetical protein
MFNHIIVIIVFLILVSCTYYCYPYYVCHYFPLIIAIVFLLLASYTYYYWSYFFCMVFMYCGLIFLLVCLPLKCQILMEFICIKTMKSCNTMLTNSSLIIYWLTYGVTIMSDSWTGPSRMSIINFKNFSNGHICISTNVLLSIPHARFLYLCMITSNK